MRLTDHTDGAETIPRDDLVPGNHVEGQVRTHRKGHLASDLGALLLRQALPVVGIGDVHGVPGAVGDQPVGEAAIAMHQVPVASGGKIGGPIRGDAHVHRIDMPAPRGVRDPVLLRRPEVVAVLAEVCAEERCAPGCTGRDAATQPRGEIEPSDDDLAGRLGHTFIREHLAACRRQPKRETKQEEFTEDPSAFHRFLSIPASISQPRSSFGIINIIVGSMGRVCLGMCPKASARIGLENP